MEFNLVQRSGKPSWKRWQTVKWRTNGAWTWLSSRGKVRADAEGRRCSRYRSRHRCRGKAHAGRAQRTLRGLEGHVCKTNIDVFNSFRWITKSWSSRVRGWAESYTRRRGARPLVRAVSSFPQRPTRGQQPRSQCPAFCFVSLQRAHCHCVASPLLTSAFAHLSIPVRVLFQICVTVPWAHGSGNGTAGSECDRRMVHCGAMRQHVLVTSACPTPWSARAWPAFPLFL